MFDLQKVEGLLFKQQAIYVCTHTQLMLKMTSLNVVVPGVPELPTTVKTIQPHKMLIVENYLQKKQGTGWYINHNWNDRKFSKVMKKRPKDK